jgi:hypothetical protein
VGDATSRRFAWRRGTSREVLLVGRWAVKLPSARCWRLFLCGLLGNMQEALWSGFDSGLCPVRWAFPGGLVVVMPRCEPLTAAEFDALDRSPWADLPVEAKACSFGRLGGRVVAVDYGS